MGKNWRGWVGVGLGLAALLVLCFESPPLQFPASGDVALGEVHLK